MLKSDDPAPPTQRACLCFFPFPPRAAVQEWPNTFCMELTLLSSNTASFYHDMPPKRPVLRRGFWQGALLVVAFQPERTE